MRREGRKKGSKQGKLLIREGKTLNSYKAHKPVALYDTKVEKED